MDLKPVLLIDIKCSCCVCVMPPKLWNILFGIKLVNEPKQTVFPPWWLHIFKIWVIDWIHILHILLSDMTPTIHTMDMLWEKYQWILSPYMKPISFQSKASVVCSIITAVFIDICLKKLNVFSQYIGQKTNEYLNGTIQVNIKINKETFRPHCAW